MASRGDAPSGYVPGFGGDNGVKIYASDMKISLVEDVITSAGVVEAFSHGFSAAPAAVWVVPILDPADLGADTSAVVVGEASVSGATSSNIYVTGNKAGARFRAYIMLG